MAGPLTKLAAKGLIERRSQEWAENQRRWRFLADSLEGGNRYRHADYAIDPTVFDPNRQAWYNQGYDPTTGQPYTVRYGQIVDRNLIPHLSETDLTGRDVYAMRLARTPVPSCVGFVLRKHLGRVYSHEVQRAGPEAIEAFWQDVDGRRSSIDKWMRKVVAPLLLTLGQLDVLVDRPQLPKGAKRPKNKREERELGLNRVLASYYLPEAVLWSRTDRTTGEYLEVLVIEREGLIQQYRHWTEDRSDLYDGDGEHIAEASWDHNLGRPPIKRLFDERKHRLTNVGQSRYETIAEIQKAIYNKRSELDLSDVVQAHPLLSGPEEYLQNDATVEVGPNSILPKKREPMKGRYEGWEYVDPPKTAAESIRQNIQDLWDEVYQEAALLKPAGAVEGKTTAQSGVSKSYDHEDANDYLSEVAETLAEAERSVAALALFVSAGGKPTPADEEAVDVVYPREFDLQTGADLSDTLNDVHGHLAQSGEAPETEKEFLQRRVTRGLPGLSDERLNELTEEIGNVVDRKAVDRAKAAEGALPAVDPNTTNANGQVEAEDSAGPIYAGAVSDLVASPMPA